MPKIGGKKHTFGVKMTSRVKLVSMIPTFPILNEDFNACAQLFARKEI